MFLWQRWCFRVIEWIWTYLSFSNGKEHDFAVNCLFRVNLNTFELVFKFTLKRLFTAKSCSLPMLKLKYVQIHSITPKHQCYLKNMQVCLKRLFTAKSCSLPMLQLKCVQIHSITLKHQCCHKKHASLSQKAIYCNIIHFTNA